LGRTPSNSDAIALYHSRCEIENYFINRRRTQLSIQSPLSPDRNLIRAQARAFLNTQPSLRASEILDGLHLSLLSLDTLRSWTEMGLAPSVLHADSPLLEHTTSQSAPPTSYDPPPPPPKSTVTIPVRSTPNNAFSSLQSIYSRCTDTPAYNLTLEEIQPQPYLGPVCLEDIHPGDEQQKNQKECFASRSATQACL
jgi:hypothetical protein